MRKVCFFSLSVLLLFLFTACSPKLSTFNGYIIDQHCFGIMDPSKETKECLTMNGCESSGYGIAIKQDDGKYKFYKFDDKGHNLVKDILSKTRKKDSFSVTSKGTQVGEIIKILSISEK